MSKTNRFHVKKFENDKSKITVEEDRKYHSPFILFFINNGKLLFTISMILSFAIFLIAVSLTISNFKDSSIVEYTSNGVVVTFNEKDESILNGIPITKEYASKVFDSQLAEDISQGVVIKIKEEVFNGGKIVFYSDKTALVKYNDGTFLRVFPVNKEYGIHDNGILNSKAIAKKVTGEYKNNEILKIELLYLSDGSIEVTKDNVSFFVRNDDITSNNDTFYTNLSMVSLPIKKEGNKVYYSNSIIKDDSYIIIEGNKYNKKEEKNIHNNIKIIYYENGYAEIIKDDLSIIVEKSEHIKYDESILEIVDDLDNKEKVNIKDIMDIKNIKLENTNSKIVHYIVVLEETDNYQNYDVTKRLDNKYINFNINVNGNTIKNNVLDNNLKNSGEMEGLSLKNNTYLLYEEKLNPSEEVSIKLGMWIDYENITNEYMNSAFIGTVKVYVESLD